MFTVTLTTAPAAKAWWKLPVVWINAADEDGNSMGLAVMKNGSVCDESGSPIGTNCDEEYVALRNAAQAAIASQGSI